MRVGLGVAGLAVAVELSAYQRLDGHRPGRNEDRRERADGRGDGDPVRVGPSGSGIGVGPRVSDVAVIGPGGLDS